MTYNREFCGRCGEPKRQGQEQCDSCREYDEHAHCTNCGEELPDDREFDEHPDGDLCNRCAAQEAGECPECRKAVDDENDEVCRHCGATIDPNSIEDK